MRVQELVRRISAQITATFGTDLGFLAGVIAFTLCPVFLPSHHFYPSGETLSEYQALQTAFLHRIADLVPPLLAFKFIVTVELFILGLGLSLLGKRLFVHRLTQMTLVLGVLTTTLWGNSIGASLHSITLAVWVLLGGIHILRTILPNQKGLPRRQDTFISAGFFILIATLPMTQGSLAFTLDPLRVAATIVVLAIFQNSLNQWPMHFFRLIAVFGLLSFNWYAQIMSDSKQAYLLHWKSGMTVIDRTQFQNFQTEN